MSNRRIDIDGPISVQTAWVQLDTSDTEDADRIRKMCEVFDGAASSTVGRDEDEPQIFWVKCLIPTKHLEKFIIKLQEPKLIN
jgi:hypothetical protein